MIIDYYYIYFYGFMREIFMTIPIITVFFGNIFVFVLVPPSPLSHSPVERNPRRANPWILSWVLITPVSRAVCLVCSYDNKALIRIDLWPFWVRHCVVYALRTTYSLVMPFCPLRGVPSTLFYVWGNYNWFSLADKSFIFLY